MHRMSHGEQRGRVGTSAVTRFISLHSFSAWLALQMSVGVGVPLVPETLPLWVKGSCRCVCVCVCVRTENRVTPNTVPWGDRLPFSSSPAAAGGSPPEGSFTSLALAYSELLSVHCSLHPKIIQGPSLLHKILGCPQPGYPAESPPGPYGYRVGLVLEREDLLRWVLT